MVLLLTAFSTLLTEALNIGAHTGSVAIYIDVRCYQARVVEYNDFLETNFDGTSNNTSPFAQINMASKANNKTYIVKEMLQRLDMDDLKEVTRKEVVLLFKE